MLSLVIPVYKNEESLPRLLREVEGLAGRPGGWKSCSSWTAAPTVPSRFFARICPPGACRRNCSSSSRNFGSFAAIAAGLRHGQGDYFAVIAADLQEPPELALSSSKCWRPGGRCRARAHARVAPTRGSRRRSRMCSGRLYRRFVLKEMPRGGVDVFGCTRQCATSSLQLREANTNLVALLLWLGFRRRWVPYERRPRQEGRSAWTFGKSWRYALDSVFSFTDLPIVRSCCARQRRYRSAPCVAAVTVFVFWWLGHDSRARLHAADARRHGLRRPHGARPRHRRPVSVADAAERAQPSAFVVRSAGVERQIRTRRSAATRTTPATAIG